MDTIRRNILLKRRDYLADEIAHPELILPSLIATKVINNEEYRSVMNEVLTHAKIRKLLDILCHEPSKTGGSFHQFCKILQENNYSWVGEMLENELTTVCEQSQEDEPDAREDLFMDVILRSGIPVKPPNFVDRINEVEELRGKLSTLPLRKHIVLHGMTGSGKSCLAAEAVQHKNLIMNTYKGYIFWVTIGDEDDILSAQLDLLQKIESHWPSYKHKEVLPTTEQKAKDTLIARVLKNIPENLKYGLLVLDNVPSKMNVAEYFDIGMRMLILTHDEHSILSIQSNCTIIKMNAGFTEHETLSLLASSVDLPIERLFPQAVEIHRKALGFPLIISLIGGLLSQYKEDAQRRPDRWMFFLEMVSRKERRRKYSGFNKCSLASPGLSNVISESLESLDAQLRSRYYQLIVFDEDVNILPTVLSILWGKSKYSVEQDMFTLVRKSLATRRWNDQLNCYVYGIHYLLLIYLQSTVDKNDVTLYHRALVENYSRHVHNDWSKLPLDNYSHLFLAKHMCLAEVADTHLPNLLLNLEFIGVRLRLNLPGDITRDFQRLRDCLQTGGFENSSILVDSENFEQFTLKWKDLLHKYPYLNILQCALQESPNSKIYTEATRLARKHPETPYFYIQQLQTYNFNLDNADLKEQTVFLPGKCTAAAFSCSYIIIAKDNGTISLWDVDKQTDLQVFNVPNKENIVCIKITDDHREFAAATDNGDVYIWSYDCICHSGNASSDTPPPRYLQVSWEQLHGDQHEPAFIKLGTGVGTTHSCMLDFSVSGQYLAWCYSKQIIVWDLSGSSFTIVLNETRLMDITSIGFGLDDAFLFVAAGDIYIYDTTTFTLTTSFPGHSPQIIYPKRDSSIEDDWCIQLNSGRVKEFTWEISPGDSDWHQSLQEPRDIGTSPSCTSIAISPNQNIIAMLTYDSQLLVFERKHKILLNSKSILSGSKIIGVSEPSKSFIRALFLDNENQIYFIDVNLNREIEFGGVRLSPIWRVNNNNHWFANVNSKGALKIVTTSGKSSGNCKDVSVISSNNDDTLIIGTRLGKLYKLNPCNMNIAKGETLETFKSSVSFVKCIDEWIIASAVDKIWVKKISGSHVCWCHGLNGKVIDVAIFNRTWLVVCTSKNIQMWDLSPLSTNNADQECVTFKLYSPTINSDISCCALDPEHNIIIIADTNQFYNFELKWGSPPKLALKMQKSIGYPIKCMALYENTLLLVAPSAETIILLKIDNYKYKSFVKHSIIANVTQISMQENFIITAGSVLAWWKIPDALSHTGTLKLMQTISFHGQCGGLKFSQDPITGDIMVNDVNGAVWYVTDNFESPRYFFYDESTLENYNYSFSQLFLSNNNTI